MKKKTIEIVLDLITRSRSLRDDDNRLIANVWNVEAKRLGYDIKEITAAQMLELIAAGKLSSANNIKRHRCKLQQDNEHLRGDKYEYKQRFVQDKWRKKMRKKNIVKFADEEAYDTKIIFTDD